MSQSSIIGDNVTTSTRNLESDKSNEQQIYQKSVIKKKSHSIPPGNYIFEHLTTFAHVCIIGVTIYLVYLSLTEFEFFNWHPILFALGWMLLMTEAVLMLTKDNICSSRISYKWRVRCHWAMQVIAIVMSVVGFIVAFLYEEAENNSHFSKDHGVYGLVAFILGLIPTCLSGIPALFNIELRQTIPPKMNKFIHAATGIASVIFGGVAMVLSLYTGWFGWKTENDSVIFVLCYIAIVFGVAGSLIRPLLTFVERIQGFIQ